MARPPPMWFDVIERIYASYPHQLSGTLGSVYLLCNISSISKNVVNLGLKARSLLKILTVPYQFEWRPIIRMRISFA